MNLAPITLFVYNRPVHTRRTIEALQKNLLAKDSDLIIFSDAPKTPDSAQAVREVREYIKMISGFRSVNIVERVRNLGLANSIIEGVTSVVSERGRIIVLEDDLVTSPYFLNFMNTALETYHDNEKVMHISGYMYPIDNADIPESLFLKIATCWGWATWSRAWRHFEKNPKKLLRGFSKQTINSFNLDGAYDFWAQVEQNEKGLIDTWAVFWYAAVFQNGGLALHPKISLVANIGHDNTGLHCGSSVTFDTQLATEPVTYFERKLTENVLAQDRTNDFLSPAKLSHFSRISLALRKRIFPS